ncbi:anthranilate phosphoribosyltransferase [Haliangium ochraceum]|uniref:Anthranilate phosphoribosyltransferase n=1 Tax=Haliangium ochraceum (strain DSM 14365 / JCM 11303 / SMP-2) TaxID=502025 RepID=D0LUE2_HALO1|nr:anthranilate phosphoribosyltransferase [Haliangium ochraceum]ACY19265.1 Anthranilate phosphoribosyltransferase [Haliangium ochraceum DSM 14365]
MDQESKLRAFGAFIVRLQQGGNLTREETRAAFNQIWRNEVTEMSQGALIAALRCKGETLDEIVGLAESHNDEWNRLLQVKPLAPEPVLGIVGVGMDDLKSVNTSSGAAIIAAACGVYVHKIGAPGMTSVSGSAQAFAIMGVDSDSSFQNALEAVRDTRLGFTSVVGEAMHQSGILRVLSQLRCGTSIHIAGPIGFHTGERHKIIGVPNPKLGRMVCEAMKLLGYEGALVPCGTADELPGKFMDELSNVGTNYICELRDGEIREYELTPEEAGLKRGSYADIAAADTMEGNVRKMARVLAGHDDGPLLDCLALNAASCMTLMGKAKTLAEGVEMGREAVKSGKARAQIEALIRAQNNDVDAGLARFDALVS